jgi:hypothetical protein
LQNPGTKKSAAITHHSTQKIRAVNVGTSNPAARLGKEVFGKEQMCITVVCIASTTYYDMFLMKVP